MLLGNNNSYQSNFLLHKPIFLYLESFYWRKLHWSPDFSFIIKSFRLDTYDKTTSWITSSCTQFVGKSLMVCFNHHWQQQYHHNVGSNLVSNIFWYDKFINNSINITFTVFTVCINQSLLLNTFSLVLLLYFFFSIYLPLDLLILRVNFYFVSKFLFFVLFRMVWGLVTVNILKYSALSVTHVAIIILKNITYSNFF